MIELRADVELKDTFVVAMPKLVGDEFYMWTIRVEYEWDLLPTKQVYQPVSKKTGATTSDKKKQEGLPKQEVSNSNPFDVLNYVENDHVLGSNGGNSKLDDKEANSPYSDSEVKEVFNETAGFMASTSLKCDNESGYDTKSSFEQ
ncbi:hypothetical protein Tco_0964945 [Tanacetum coccineum]